MNRKGRLLKHQDVGESNAHSGEGSVYWNYVEQHNRRSTEGTFMESKFANPDVLADDPKNMLWGNGSKPELAELIIERFADERGNFPILSSAENKVLHIYIQTGDIKIVMAKLNITRSSFNTYMARIQKKFKRLLLVLNY